MFSGAMRREKLCQFTSQYIHKRKYHLSLVGQETISQACYLFRCTARCVKWPLSGEEVEYFRLFSILVAREFNSKSRHFMV